jgi:2-oxoglutarate dehydrogenase complex dehydrogenase (E1) component-like enzyme
VFFDALFQPVEQLKTIIAQYPNADDFVWAQEEPKIWEHTALC